MGIAELGRKIVSVSLVALLAAACAAPPRSTNQHINPVAEEVTNEVSVEDDFDVVWDRLIAGLSRSFFVINNVEKVSRIINVSFSSSSPAEFIDCGRSSRTFNTERFNYETAESSSFKQAGPKWGDYGNLSSVQHINRVTSLNGRVNIYVGPNSENTTVSVNARYVFGVVAGGTFEGLDAFGNVSQRGSVQTDNYSMTFNSNDPGEGEGMWDGGRFVCRSKGTLERQILDLVR